MDTTERETEDQSPPELTRKDGLMAMLYASPIMLLFAYLGNWQRGLGAWACAGIVLLVVRMRWDLRNRAWFWVTVATMGVLQIPLVWYVPWSNTNLSSASLLPVGLLDFGIVYGCVKLAEKVMGKQWTCAFAEGSFRSGRMTGKDSLCWAFAILIEQLSWPTTRPELTDAAVLPWL